MKKHTILLFATLVLSYAAAAQTKVLFSHVQAMDRQDSLRGTDATIQLTGTEGSGSAMLVQHGDIAVKVGAKVSTHNVARSSVKDSAVNLILDIAMKAGRDKDSKRVEKIFYMDQKRSGTVSQRFTFKQGLDVRTITLTFNVAVE